MAAIARRKLLSAFGGAAAWPVALYAQQRMPVIGFLNGGSANQYAYLVSAFLRGLGELGYVQQRDFVLEYRWAEGHVDRLPTLATELVSAQVGLICAGTPPAAVAARDATKTIPIVFTSGEDPVKLGLVASYNRPGGNATGVALLLDLLSGKRLGLLRDLVPNATLIAVLLDPTWTHFQSQLKDVQEAAHAVGQRIHILHASTEGEIDAAFAAAKEVHADAMMLGTSIFFTVQMERIVGLATRAALPTIYFQRDCMAAGGLMSYGTDLAAAYRQAGIYAAKILSGARPAELPVVQLDKFELLINVRVAKSLGLKISDNLLSLADEVIE